MALALGPRPLLVTLEFQRIPRRHRTGASLPHSPLETARPSKLSMTLSTLSQNLDWLRGSLACLLGVQGLRTTPWPKGLPHSARSGPSEWPLSGWEFLHLPLSVPVSALSLSRSLFLSLSARLRRRPCDRRPLARPTTRCFMVATEDKVCPVPHAASPRP